MRRWALVIAALWMAVTPWPIDAPHVVSYGDWLWRNGGDGMDLATKADFVFHVVWVVALLVTLAWPWIDRGEA